ncbi:MAG: hypothetical protein ABR976_07340 [Terracidiphilus sp.]|jgi:hypothetical protein
MKHLTEEELIGRYYNERGGEGEDFAGAKEDFASIEEHLAACEACAETYAALSWDLGEIKVVQAPARDEAYGERVWATLEPKLVVYRKERWSWMRGRVLSGLSYAAVCGLLVAGAFIAGRLSVEKEKQPQVAQTPAPKEKPRVVVVVLSDHLDRSERFLVELKHVDASSTEMVSPLRDEAKSLLAANKICRQKATQEDDPALTTALDRLDHVLDGLANERGGLNSAAIERLQEEMNAEGLLFEVRVLRSRIPDEQGTGMSRSSGGTI